MRCYYHPHRQALGVCKHCQRGLCSQCGALVDDTLACIDRHEWEVAELNLAARRAGIQSQRIKSGYGRNAIFYGLVGAVFAIFGLMEYRFLGLQAVFFFLIGLFLLYAAVANYLEARRY